MIARFPTTISAENTPPTRASSGQKTKRGGVGDGPPSPTGRFFFKVPSLSDETKRAITKASAWPVFVGVCDAIREQQRRGKTDRIRQLASEGTIGIGIKQLCRTVGISPATGRRQLARLEKLELLHVHRPPPVIKADPITGRIKEKKGGRSKRVIIYLTIQDSHLRPMSKVRIDPYSDDAPDLTERSKGQSEPHNGVQSEPPADSYKVRSEPPSKDSPNKYQRRRQPPASGESGSGSRRMPGRLPAGPGLDDRPPEPFTGPDADRLAYTRDKLAREKAQREAAEAARAAERDKRDATPTSEPDSLEATPMNPATVRAADAATAADKPPHSIRESKLDDRPRTAVQPRPTPSQPRPPTAADRAAFDVLNDTPREVIEAKQWQGCNSRKEMLLQQLAAAARADDGVSMTRETIPIESPPAGSVIGRMKQAWQRLTG